MHSCTKTTLHVTSNRGYSKYLCYHFCTSWLFSPTASTCRKGSFILRTLLACLSWSGSRENHSILPQLLEYVCYSGC